jgi:TPP-dependent pyruvate/acetoin dehydrogenase alpha subunit
MSDPAKYRTKEEVQDYREHRDPIAHAAAELAKLGVKEEELKAIDKEIKDIVVEAAKFAEDAPEPDAAELAKLGFKEEDLKAIDKEIKDIVVEAAKFAEDAPEPEASELYTDVLVESY